MISTLPFLSAAMRLEKLIGASRELPDTERMPVLFVGHGSPMNAIEENEFVQGFRSIGKQLPKPVAILCVSAHWETSGTLITSMPSPKTIHDFGGFPKALYEVEYPAPGNPELAEYIRKNTHNATIEADHQWGLDHGSWTVIKHFYPEADVPVLQLSLDYRMDTAAHYALAKELGYLRRKGVLIVGSGNIVHNLGRVAWDKMHEDNYGFDWALEANDYVKSALLNYDHTKLINYRQGGAALDLAVPTPEHYLPLLYCAGLQEEGEKPVFFNDKAVAGSLTMTSVHWGL